MRYVLALLVFALTFGVQSFAQSPPLAVEDFRLGMGFAEVRARNPRWSERPDRPAFSLPGEPILFGPQSYRPEFGFVAGVLRSIELNDQVTTSPQGCERRFLQVLSHVERAFGPLEGSETLWDIPEQPKTEHATTGGSSYRSYNAVPGSWRGSANSGAPFGIQVHGTHFPPSARNGTCMIRIQLRDDYGLSPSTSPPSQPAADFIDAARFEGGRFTTIAPPRTLGDAQAQWPPFAYANTITGVVELDCLVLVDLSLGCRVAGETPEGVGFGAAALAMTASVRAEPEGEGGPPVGARVVRRVRFQ